MDYQSALRFFGGTQAALATALGITQPTVSEWKGVIPKAYQFQIHVLSDGKLKVDPEHLPKGSVLPASSADEERAA